MDEPSETPPFRVGDFVTATSRFPGDSAPIHRLHFRVRRVEREATDSGWAVWVRPVRTSFECLSYSTSWFEQSWKPLTRRARCVLWVRRTWWRFVVSVGTGLQRLGRWMAE